jgi:hypothetical protein
MRPTGRDQLPQRKREDPDDPQPPVAKVESWRSTFFELQCGHSKSASASRTLRSFSKMLPQSRHL